MLRTIQSAGIMQAMRLPSLSSDLLIMYMPCGASGCCLNAENSSMYARWVGTLSSGKDCRKICGGIEKITRI